MRERPILFSGPMVRAILAGTKTQTRRLLQGEFQSFEEGWSLNGKEPRLLREDWCPYGAPGDRLWARETWRQGDGGSAYFRADEEWNAEGGDGPAGIGWRPSIFMPRHFSRLTLEVTEVRVQRLQEISEADAEAEGIVELTPDRCLAPSQMGLAALHVVAAMSRVNRRVFLGSALAAAMGMAIPPSGGALSYTTPPTARELYGVLWDSINGKRAPWESNPWVWAVSFRPAEGTKK